MRTLCLLIALTLMSVAHPVSAQSRYPDRLDVRSESEFLGFEIGYNDGYGHGARDRLEGLPADYQNDDAYRRALHGYRQSFGARDSYQSGYRDAYRRYEDGYNGNRRERVNRQTWINLRGEEAVVGTAGQTSSTDSAYQAGFDRGRDDGYRLGLQDVNEYRLFGVERHPEFQDASAGYDRRLGRLDQYQAGYREGFRAGYKDGYGRPQWQR